MYPPFAVARRARPAGGSGQAPPMSPERRIANYARQNGGRGVPLAPGQNRRWLKARNRRGLAAFRGRRSPAGSQAGR
jgi:hypothetical protein